jgi:Na+/H+-dicarboxylate symporter
MKLWLKMLFAITIGIIIGIFLPNFKNIYQFIFKPISNLAINLLLYLTVVYVFVKFFIGIIDLKKNKLFKKTFYIFFICILVSVLFSILISITIMNLNFFHPDNSFQQQSYNLIEPISIDNFLSNIINKNIFLSFQTPSKYIIPIIFIAFIFGLAAFYSEKKGIYFVDTIESFDHILDKIIKGFLEFYPLGVIFITAYFIKSDIFSYKNFVFFVKPLIAITIISIFLIIIYFLTIYIFLKQKSFKYFIGYLGSVLFAFTTSNTAAVIAPLTEHLKNNIGVKKEVADTLTPLGMIINKSGTVVVSSVVLMSLILIYSPDILTFNLQLLFIVLLFIFSLFLDGNNQMGFLVLTTTILNINFLHLEQDSYLLFLVSIPLLNRIGLMLDTLSTSIYVTIAAKMTDKLESKTYIDFI